MGPTNYIASPDCKDYVLLKYFSILFRSTTSYIEMMKDDETVAVSSVTGAV